VILPDQKLVRSIRDRLLDEAHKRGQNYGEYLERYALRGVLDRLSRSPYRDQFVLKGGQVIIAWGVPLGRPTRDIDLRGYVENSVNSMVQIVKEICQQPVEPPDALIFDPNSVNGHIIQEIGDYQGIRGLFLGNLGKSPFHMQIDIGFTDEITPSDILVSYPSMLGLPAPRLRGYRPETVIAEKFQAMVFLGEINSRMRDFYDIWLLSRQCDFDGATLQKAITATFQNRATTIPIEMPAALSDEFAIEKQRLWKGFLAKFPSDPGDITNFQQVMSQLRTFLLPLLQATATKRLFRLSWKAGGAGWLT
jgi:hypothetical protein